MTFCAARDLPRIMPFVTMQPPLQGYHRQAPQPATDQPAPVSQRSCRREARNLVKIENLLDIDILDQLSQPGTENDPQHWRRLPARANQRNRLVNQLPINHLDCLNKLGLTVSLPKAGFQLYFFFSGS